MVKHKRGRRRFLKNEANESSCDSGGLLLLASAARNLDMENNLGLGSAMEETDFVSNCNGTFNDSDIKVECEDLLDSKPFNEGEEDGEMLTPPLPLELNLVFKLLDDDILTNLYKARGSVCTECKSKRYVDEMVICNCNCFVDTLVCLNCFLNDCSCSTSTGKESIVSETMKISIAEEVTAVETNTAYKNVTENTWTSDIELDGVPFELKIQLQNYEQIMYETSGSESLV